ncbi:hypothetical protein LguiA_022962 [Lonicera macranthoides]
MAGPGKRRSTQSTVNSSLQTPLSPQEFSGLETGAFSSAIVPPSHENNVSSNGDNPMPERHVTSTTGQSMVKRKRGPTRNISLAKMKVAGQKLLVEISADDNQIVGSDSSSFIAEGGCVVRKQATLQVTKWARIMLMNARS